VLLLGQIAIRLISLSKTKISVQFQILIFFLVCPHSKGMDECFDFALALEVLSPFGLEKSAHVVSRG
jgi:hypothetical protein